jgi:hypothetical protein
MTADPQPSFDHQTKVLARARHRNTDEKTTFAMNHSRADSKKEGSALAVSIPRPTTTDPP